MVASKLDERAREQFLADANATPDWVGQPRAFRVGTAVWMAASLALIVAPALGGFPLPLAAVALMVALPVTTIRLVRDVRLSKLCGRLRPEQALLCYFKGIRWRRWDLAHAALAPLARHAEVEVPRIRELKSHWRPTSRSTPAALTDYWREFSMGSEGLSRRLAKVEYASMGGDDSVRRYRVTLVIKHYPTWYLLWFLLIGWLIFLAIPLVSRTYTTTLDVEVGRHASQWWVLDGEMAGPEDGSSYVAPLPVAKIRR